MASLSEINDHLFAQMERLASGKLKGEDLADELKRTEGLVTLADQMVDGSRLQLDAAKLFANIGPSVLPYLPQIGPPKASQ